MKEKLAHVRKTKAMIRLRMRSLIMAFALRQRLFVIVILLVISEFLIEKCACAGWSGPFIFSKALFDVMRNNHTFNKETNVDINLIMKITFILFALN